MAINQENGGAGGQMTPGMGVQPQGMGMQSRAGNNGQSGDESVKAQIEYRAKMKKYKEKHDKAVEVFQRIAGTTVTTREGAISTLAKIMDRGNPKEKAEAIMAAGDFCWACNEEDAEKDVKEEVTTFSGLMR